MIKEEKKNNHITHIDEYIENIYNKIYETSFEEKKGGGGESLDFADGIDSLVSLFSKIKENNNTTFFIGNGGSAAIAEHMTADFMKNGGMKTYSLYDSAVNTCISNDYGYEDIFARPLDFLIREKDLLVAISSSGNSPDIVKAIAVAQKRKAYVLTLTGFSENNKCKSLGDYNVHVPSKEYGVIESIHNLLLQEVVDKILERDGVCL